MAFAPNSETDTGRVAGEFRADTGVFFQFSTAMDEAERLFGAEFDRKVWMSDGSFRFAKVMKTRVKVVVDEAADGSAVVEVWNTRVKFFQTED